MLTYVFWVKISEARDVKLKMRTDAIKMCLLITFVLPFTGSMGGVSGAHEMIVCGKGI